MQHDHLVPAKGHKKSKVSKKGRIQAQAQHDVDQDRDAKFASQKLPTNVLEASSGLNS